MLEISSAVVIACARLLKGATITSPTVAALWLAGTVFLGITVEPVLLIVLS